MNHDQNERTFRNLRDIMIKARLSDCGDCVTKMCILCCRMPCPKCFEEGRHHPWCVHCPAWGAEPTPTRDLSNDDVTGGGGAEVQPWGPSPTEWLLQSFQDPSEMELPKLSVEADLAEVNDPDDDIVEHIMELELAETGEADSGLEEEERKVINSDDGMGPWTDGERTPLPRSTGVVGPNTPLGGNLRHELEDRNKMWKQAQELASALVEHIQTSQACEPKAAKRPRLTLSSGPSLADKLYGSLAGSSTGPCNCPECKERRLRRNRRR
jgi:hypothetical protein